MTRKRALVCVGAIVVVGLAGCAGGGEPQTSDTSGTEASRTSSEKDESSSRADESSDDATSSSPSPTPTQVRAADGTNLKACRDADCEVKVRTGDKLRPTQSDLPLDVITVADLGQDRITLTMKGSTGKGLRLQGMQINVSSECVNGDCKDTGRLTITSDLSGRIDEVEVRLVQVSGDRAVLALG